MTKEQQIDLLIQCGIAKLFNENSSYLFGELKGKEKYFFDKSFNANEKLLYHVEKRINKENATTLELLVEAMNDGIVNLRKELLNGNNI